jgi:hypothetical protein
MKSKLTINQDGTKEWKLPNGIRHREDGLNSKNPYMKLY